MLLFSNISSMNKKDQLWQNPDWWVELVGECEWTILTPGVILEAKAKACSALERDYYFDTSRHFIKSDTTRYLDQLEIEFKDKPKDLELVKKIIVLDDEHILIAWFIHKVWIVDIVPESEEHWIFKKEWFTLFDYNSAKFSTDLLYPEYAIYSASELRQIFAAIPGFWTSRHIEIILGLLNIPLIGNYSKNIVNILSNIGFTNSVNILTSTLHSTSSKNNYETVTTWVLCQKDVFPYFSQETLDSGGVLILYRKQEDIAQ